jgi:hypothetical protein
MKKIISLCFLCAFVTSLLAQKETFDLVSFAAPKKWTKETTGNIVSFTIVNKKSREWCRINIVKSTISKGSIELDFESEWQELVVKNYNPSDTPQTGAVLEMDGWKIKAGRAKFTFENSDAIAILTTMSGYDRCASIVAITNSESYLEDIEALLSSVDVKKLETTGEQLPHENSVIGTAGDEQTTIEIQKEPVKQTVNYAFTTTNFDDGWTSTAQEDWVQVSKGVITALVHYPNKQADAYNSVVIDGLKNAWNILVAPKYSTASNFEFKPISGWQTMEFAEADAVEKITGKTVHVVLFKKNYSNGSGKYVEIITPDKNSFEQEFGVYNSSATSWDKLENLVTYNKFAVAATDLAGKWTNNYTGAIQYVNAHTGLDAGMNTHASVENFQFGPGNTYKWDLGVASGAVGNIKFQSAKSNGRFSMTGNWQVNFSDIEKKPRTYDVHFSCIKGLRILWINGTAYFKTD